MVELVGVLATYSITIKELKYFLAALQVKDNGKWVSVENYYLCFYKMLNSTLKKALYMNCSF